MFGFLHYSSISYIKFALDINDLKNAEKLIASALLIKGITKSRILYYRAALFEIQHKYNDAVRNVRLARQYCQSKEANTFLEEELDRIQLKDKTIKEQKARINIILK